MLTMTLLAPSKETENTLRWETYIPEDKTKFFLYIPKWRIPQPWPSRIFVSIDKWQPLNQPKLTPKNARPDLLKNPIRMTVYRVSDHTRSIHFAPKEDDKVREIGEPYIPFSLLPSRDTDKVIIEVKWDLSSIGHFSDYPDRE